MRAIIVKVILILIFLFNVSVAQEQINGRWVGNISFKEKVIGIHIEFKTINDSLNGNLGVTKQNNEKIPLSNIVYDYPILIFNIAMPGGNTLFSCVIINDSIAGSLTQLGTLGKFHLIKSNETKDEILPYAEEEVTFLNGDIELAGTLTLPEYPGKHPAVVMITGSGAQNRDEEIYGFRLFKIIADHFTRNGIAVLRYDDRGVGGSTGNISESTTEDFAGDAIEAVKYLQSRDDIRKDQIGLCGHSEGGIVAPLAASKFNNIAFILLIAGTGVTGEKIIIKQTELIMKADGSTEEEIKNTLELSKKVFTALKSNMEKEEIIAEIKQQISKNYDKLPDELKETIEDKEIYSETTAIEQYNQLSSPWMEYFLAYDPAPTLEKVSCPVLMLFGELDLQVPVTQNEQPMVEALIKGGNKDFEVKIFQKANHLFQSANNGSPSEYGNLPKEFIPGFLNFMSAWILERFSVSR
jgi:pimeloyl-ACP methyl ester carboxylesterase